MSFIDKRFLITQQLEAFLRMVGFFFEIFVLGISPVESGSPDISRVAQR